MELMLPGAENHPTPAAMAAGGGNRNTGRRKGPNLDRVDAVGSSKRVTGTIPYEHWGDRQYADAKAYIAKKSSAQRNAEGCYEFTGKGKIGEKAAVASFCGVRYDVQMFFYLAHHRNTQMQPDEKIIASCGNRKCLTDEHLSRADKPIRRTCYYTLEQWASMNGEVALKEQLLKITS